MSGRNCASACVAAMLIAAATVGTTARGSDYVPPPIMPVPNAWQGRSQAVLRVLDKLDAHIETLTLKAGETGTYKSLSVTVRSCMDRPDGLPRDSGAFLNIQDHRAGDIPSFSGWTFSGEPSVGVFESPIFGVQLVTCQGDMVAPVAPPLPPPVPPPASMVSGPPPTDASADAGAGAGDGSSGAPATQQPPGGQDPDAQGALPPGGGPGGGPPPGRPANPQAGAPDGDATQPDPVYPDGAPPAAPAQPPPSR